MRTIKSINGMIIDDSDDFKLIIDDDKESKTTTYSSEKINELVVGVSAEDIQNAVNSYLRENGVNVNSSINYDDNVKSVNHRGYSTTAPENTIPAYIMSKEKGFKYVECDVSFTSDNVAVLLHDSTIDRTSDGEGSISSLSYDEVLQYDFGSWKGTQFTGTKIPTFEEFIMVCKGLGLHPYIELKSNGNYTQEQILSIVKTVKECGMEGKVTYISFNILFLEYVKDANEKARLGYLCDVTSSTINQALALKTGTNSVFMDVSYSNLTDDKVNMCIDNDLPLEIWTVNYADIITGMHKYITGVTSDNLIAGQILFNYYNSYDYGTGGEDTGGDDTGGEDTGGDDTGGDNTGGDDTNEITTLTLNDEELAKGKIETSVPYYLSATNRRTYQSNKISLKENTSATVTISGPNSYNWALWFVTDSGLKNVCTNTSLGYYDYKDSGWVENGGSITVPEGTKTIWLNIKRTDNGDISSDELSVEITGQFDEVEPYILNWDLTSSLTDSVLGHTIELGGSATQSSEGLKLTSASDYAHLFYKAAYHDITMEFDVSSMDCAFDEVNQHGRLIVNGNGNAGLIYRKTGYWQVYGTTNSWSETQTHPDVNYFNGKTIAIKYGRDGSFKVYDGENIMVDNSYLDDYTNISLGSAVGNSFYNVTITGIRVYFND